MWNFFVCGYSNHSIFQLVNDYPRTSCALRPQTNKCNLRNFLGTRMSTIALSNGATRFPRIALSPRPALLYVQSCSCILFREWTLIRECCVSQLHWEHVGCWNLRYIVCHKFTAVVVAEAHDKFWLFSDFNGLSPIEEMFQPEKTHKALFLAWNELIPQTLGDVINHVNHANHLIVFGHECQIDLSLEPEIVFPHRILLFLSSSRDNSLRCHSLNQLILS